MSLLGIRYTRFFWAPWNAVKKQQQKTIRSSIKNINSNNLWINIYRALFFYGGGDFTSFGMGILYWGEGLHKTFKSGNYNLFSLDTNPVFSVRNAVNTITIHWIISSIGSRSNSYPNNSIQFCHRHLLCSFHSCGNLLLVL